MTKSETRMDEIEDKWTEATESELICMCCSEVVEPRLVGFAPNGPGNPVTILRCPECLAAGEAIEFEFPESEKED